MIDNKQFPESEGQKLKRLSQTACSSYWLNGKSLLMLHFFDGSNIYSCWFFVFFSSVQNLQNQCFNIVYQSRKLFIRVNSTS